MLMLLVWRPHFENHLIWGSRALKLDRLGSESKEVRVQSFLCLIFPLALYVILGESQRQSSASIKENNTVGLEKG